MEDGDFRFFVVFMRCNMCWRFLGQMHKTCASRYGFYYQKKIRYFRIVVDGTVCADYMFYHEIN